jgi:hypothetical protein
MKHNLNDPIHNPFHNRFHVPVHSRLDEMQAHKHVIWLKDPSPLNGEQRPNKTDDHGYARSQARLRW